MRTGGTLPVVQVVRRYGRVGGMESYVWHLATELAALGEQVVVVCETSHESPPAGVRVLEVGQPLRRPRWLNYALFSRRVGRVLSREGLADAIVHSHERSASHDVTTIHSAPFGPGVHAPWSERCSPRVRANRWLEARELHGSPGRPVQVIPVSKVIADALHRAYPALGGRIGAPISPGVEPLPPRPPRPVPTDGGVLGFVGQEWRRKGLPRFLAIAAELARTRPALELLILGPAPAEVDALCRASGVRYRSLGWTRSRDHYGAMDLLLHPASNEAYGMVIAEALACGLPVVVSDACGAAGDVPQQAGTVLSLSAPLRDWAGACDHWLSHRPAPAPVRSWQDVAHAYQAVYRSITTSTPKRT